MTYIRIKTKYTRNGNTHSKHVISDWYIIAATLLSEVERLKVRSDKNWNYFRLKRNSECVIFKEGELYKCKYISCHERIGPGCYTYFEFYFDIISKTLLYESRNVYY